MRRPIFNKHKLLGQMIRVDHAGEYGAERIYSAQIRVCIDNEDKNLLKKMYNQELVHLNYFNDNIPIRKVRPTVLLPLWHHFSYMLGYTTGKLGMRSSMICTEAVEEVIDKHYENQKQSLSNFPGEKQLIDSINRFQSEEIEHKELAEKYLSNMRVREKMLYCAIKYICKTAIFLTKRF